MTTPADTTPAPAAPNAHGAIPPALAELPLTLSVRLGEARMTVAELTALAEGSEVTLGARADAPLDVCIGARVIARGELTQTEDGTLAVRLTETVG